MNTFETSNFWYKVTSDNGGYKSDWKTAPFNDEVFSNKIAIPANTVQSYTVSMTLHGTGEEQNIDQGRVFKAKIKVLLED